MVAHLLREAAAYFLRDFIDNEGYSGKNFSLRLVKKIRFNEAGFGLPLHLSLGDYLDDCLSGKPEKLIAEGWGWLPIHLSSKENKFPPVQRYLQVIDYQVKIGDDGLSFPSLSPITGEYSNCSSQFLHSSMGLSLLEQWGLEAVLEKAQVEALTLDENRFAVGRLLKAKLAGAKLNLRGYSSREAEILRELTDSLETKEKEQKGKVIYLSDFVSLARH